MTTAPVAPQASRPRPETRKAPWNRTLHRIGSMVAVLVMLWLSVTGMMIQVTDLHAIWTHEPPTTPTMLSMAEGTYGPPDYAVIQASDFGAPALPAGFDLRQGVHTVLQAVRAQRDGPAGANPAAPSSAGRHPAGTGFAADAPRGGPLDEQPGPMAWVEMRMIDGAPAGQVMLGTRLVAFDARTGAPITPVPAVLLPQGGRLPPSLRQNVKILHRFWNRHDTPGVYFEFLVGLVLLFLIISGLALYFQMLGLRFRQGSRQPFWTAGGWWRSTHRIVSAVAAVFLLLIALSGTWIGFESSAGPLRRVLMSPAGGQPGAPVGRRQRNPADFTIPLRNPEVEEMTDTALVSMKERHPSTPIKVLRLRIFGQMKQGVFVTGGNDTDQYVFNADTGEPASLTEQGYPATFPFGTQVHENVKHFHSGAMFGVTGRVMNFLTGFSLAFLSISGLVVYFTLWTKRRRAGKGSFAWR